MMICIRVFIEDGRIKIQIDDIDNFPIGAQPVIIDAEILWFMGRRNNIYEYAQKYYLYDDPVQAEVALIPETLSDLTSSVKMDAIKRTFSVKSVIYTLPTYVPFALDFLSVFDELVRSQHADKCIQFIEHDVRAALLNDATLFSDILRVGDRAVMLGANNVALATTLAERILSIGDLTLAYQPVCKALARLHKHGSQSIASKLRFASLTGIKPLAANLHIGKPVAERMKLIYSLQRNFLKEGRGGELDATISELRAMARHRFFATCIGKDAPFGQYEWNYTEWKLLQFATFIVRRDGRLSIPLVNNIGYSEYYSEGMDNHDKIQSEFEHLGKVIGFELDKDTDFHKELIFTPDCTERLLSLGMHYNKEYMQAMLKLMVMGSVIRQCFELSMMFKSISSDVIKIIMGYAFEEQYQKLHPIERESARLYGWGELFALRPVAKPEDNSMPCAVNFK